jgi:hypothetical protein
MMAQSQMQLDKTEVYGTGVFLAAAGLNLTYAGKIVH